MITAMALEVPIQIELVQSDWLEVDWLLPNQLSEQCLLVLALQQLLD